MIVIQLPPFPNGTIKQRTYATDLRREFIARSNANFENDRTRFQKRTTPDREILLRDVAWREEYYAAILQEPDQKSVIWWIDHSHLAPPYSVSVDTYFEYLATDLIADRRRILLWDGGDYREWVGDDAEKARGMLRIYQEQGGRAYLKANLLDLQSRIDGLFPLTLWTFNLFMNDSDYTLREKETNAKETANTDD